MNKINSILNEVLEKINPPKEEKEAIDKALANFLKKTRQKIVNLKLNAEIFVGGSFAKNTAIKKDYYDLDIFIRFEKKKDQDISSLTEKIIGTGKNILRIHGSRDYFQIKIKPDFFIEIVPVIKIKNPKEAGNITDLSYSHVKYIKSKVKKEVLDQIMLAKAFCYANKCYGAESYINGFSGYALELLVYYYGSFLKFITAISKIKEKLIIDIEKHYKNKQQVLMDINASKLGSPIILIDPTHKQRNALAALSKETLIKFQKDCIKFLKTPSAKLFELQKTDLEKIKSQAKKNKQEFLLLLTKTNKQKGDVAGSKLLKFYNHLSKEITKYFEVKNKGFNYDRKQSARYFFVVKNKKEILIEGPTLANKFHVEKFKKRHHKSFVKNKRLYYKSKIDFNIKKFIDAWIFKNKRQLKEMYIEKLKILK